MRSNLNIALLGQYFGWGGGIDFLRHVANGLLTKQSENNLSLFLLLPVDNKIESIKDFARAAKQSLIKSIADKSPSIAWPISACHPSMFDFFSHVQAGLEVVQYANTPEGLLRALKKIKADVALPVNGSLGKDYPIPWIGYVPDFQHKHLPDNFNLEECFGRDIQFAKTFSDSAAAIVNSIAVKDDVFRFYPSTETMVYNLPFSPNPMPEWFLPHPEDIKAKYNLPEKYFLISNQFWIHKDHLTAFKALSRLRLACNASMLCTGALDDYRWPSYILEVKDFLADNSLTERVKLLGHIPKRDQIEIMKKSIAVIQPTLFEGGPGGGSVYDAVSLGVPVILSDIPVNTEVDADHILFFKAGDSEDLSRKMRDVLQKIMFRPTQDALLMMGRLNLERLGDRLLEAVSYVV
jgi:glycosyltransferase involved in cell wall biosynthesis